MVVVSVIKAFTHEGRTLTAGETVTVEPLEAAALHRRGVVSLSRVSPLRTKVITSEPETAQAPEPSDSGPHTRRRRTYRRRDLVAEG